MNYISSNPLDESILIPYVIRVIERGNEMKREVVSLILETANSMLAAGTTLTLRAITSPLFEEGTVFTANLADGTTVKTIKKDGKLVAV